jgi:serine protease Do/serine protease DegQ
VSHPAHLPLWVAAALALAATGAQGALPAALGSDQTLSLAPMIKRVSPAVVNVATRGTVNETTTPNPPSNDRFYRHFFNSPPDLGPRGHTFQTAGSGVIFDAAAGYILTNAHVIENAGDITVTLQDGRDLKARVIGSDVPSDIAVLKVEAQGLTPMALGDSSKLEVGDFVVAIGNPFGLQHTVTSGIISGLSRSGVNPDGFEDFIQTDASINPGNSGGALVNLKGELIGINSAILSRNGGSIGIGFAIPINMVKNVSEQLLRFGTVNRGLLGVNIYTVTPDIAHSLGLTAARGVLVTQVFGGSAADQAGVRTGDVITTVNHKGVASNSELRNDIGMLRAGEAVDIGVIRDGATRHLTATISSGEKPSAVIPVPAAPPVIDIPHGLDGASFTDAPNSGGVLVTGIEPGGPAELQGLRENDLIVRINRIRVTSLEQLREHTPGTASAVIEVRRGKANILIPLR